MACSYLPRIFQRDEWLVSKCCMDQAGEVCTKIVRLLAHQLDQLLGCRKITARPPATLVLGPLASVAWTLPSGCSTHLGTAKVNPNCQGSWRRLRPQRTERAPMSFDPKVFRR